MQTAEIIDGLRGTLSRTTPPQYKRALQAAIAALAPVPITEAGLREVGFVTVSRGDSYTRDLAGNHCFACLWWWKDGGMAVELADGDCYDLHITSMQRLREVIAALEGDADAS